LKKNPLFILVAKEADYEQLCKMVIQATSKEEALSIAKKRSDLYNFEWGFEQQEWEAYETSDKDVYENPKEKILLSVVM